MDDSISASSQKVSKFNSTLAILIRIDLLWKDTHRHSRDGKYEKWNVDLDRVWCELASDADDKDEKKLSELNEEIEKIGFKKEVMRTGEVKLINLGKLYSALMKKEIFLRKLQDKQGKGVKHEESVEDYFDS